MSLLLAGCLGALFLLPLPGSLKALFCVAGGVIGVIITLTLSGHRNGVFVRLGARLSGFPWTRWLWKRLPVGEGNLREMDEVITRAYNGNRARFFLAVGCEVGTRVLMGVELYIILRGIGFAVTLPDAVFLYALYSLVINVIFFTPLNLGVREGGLMLGLESLSLPPMMGVYVGVVIRLREIFWIMVGLLFILAGTRWRPGTAGKEHP